MPAIFLEHGCHLKLLPIVFGDSDGVKGRWLPGYDMPLESVAAAAVAG
jgi:hypothetical protein